MCGSIQVVMTIFPPPIPTSREDLDMAICEELCPLVHIALYYGRTSVKQS